MTRIMGLDLGTKTIGVALSDPFKMIASSYGTIQRTKFQEDCKQLKEIAEANEVEKIVLGFPKNMDNSIGASAQRALSFQDELEKALKIPVILQDERLSTVSAERVLIETGTRREKRKRHIDSIAATFILQTYLDGMI